MKESIIDRCNLWLPDAQSSRVTGQSLASTIYDFPLTIGISGSLGAGKTTVLQGFFRALGISEHVTSPTYALEQRYSIGNWPLAIGNSPLEVLHIDLYRLGETQARALIDSTLDHTGIRCIEWPERAGVEWLRQQCERMILIELEETKETKVAKVTKRQTTLDPLATLAPLDTSKHISNGRILNISFIDIPLPSRRDIETWREEVRLPKHIASHCDAVANFSGGCAKILMERGMIVRPLALRRSAEVHDLLRFIDFRAGAAPDGGDRVCQSEEEKHCWASLKKRYRNAHHEEACARFLAEKGFTSLGRIVATHGLTLGSGARTTIEQKLLYYDDKRVMVDTVVSLEERFEDFRRRYSNGEKTEQSEQWYEEVKAVERELFPEGAP